MQIPIFFQVGPLFLFLLLACSSSPNGPQTTSTDESRKTSADEPPSTPSGASRATATDALPSTTSSGVPRAISADAPPSTSSGASQAASSGKPQSTSTGKAYSWPRNGGNPGTLQSRIAPPAGYERVPLPSGSFGEWLRGLPIKPGRPPVYLYNGQKKGNQSVHVAVVDIDVGKRDLQQCADAVIRLRAEYLWGTQHRDRIRFNFTSGDVASYQKWASGYRPRIDGNKVTWSKTAARNDSYQSFRGYLETVFTYAGTYSLSRELARVKDVRQIRAGDVFIKGGFPGHAVLVADMAVRAEDGSKVFLLVQSYMPAQEIHVLKNPRDPTQGPWYPLTFGEELWTPEWTFERGDLHRFRDPS